MTTRLALVFAALIAGALTADAMVYESANAIFLAKKLIELFEWLAFWR
ncbi:MAG: hypothetical protein AAF618_08045 [Pseudomonadota bacterium]